MTAPANSTAPLVGDAPVALFIFNRPDVTRRVFEAVAAARPRRLFVICDGPRPHVLDDQVLVAQTREVCSRVDWPCEVQRIYADENMGCKYRIASGLRAVFERVDRAIVLEDDCLPHPSFFRYCRELLQRYEDDSRIFAISGSNCLTAHAAPVRTAGEASYYFSNYFHCWGWATWRRSWEAFDLELEQWSSFRSQGRLQQVFDALDEQLFWTRVFDLQAAGDLTSWAYPFLFSCWAAGGLSITPRVNMISNLGFDDRATHTKRGDERMANLPVWEMGSLTHPDRVVRDERADRRMFARDHFNDRRGLRRWMWVAKQLWAQRNAA